MKNKNKKMTSFNSSEHIAEKVDGPYHGFGYLNLVSDHLDLTCKAKVVVSFHGVKQNYCKFAPFNRVVDTKTIIIQMGQNISNIG